MKQEKLSALLTEQRNPASENIDTLPTEQMLAVINAEDAKIAAFVQDAIPWIGKAVDAIAGRMRQGGRLFYIGAGTSGRLGVLDASECRPTFNIPQDMVQGIMAGGEAALVRATEASEDDSAAGVRDLQARGFQPMDSVVGIAASGRTPYVLGAIDWARGAGGFTAGISCAPDSALSRQAEVGIEIPVGPEVLTGSTRMKAGTATKLVLNMLSTGVMIRLGYVFGNLMVNVQPTNDKLRDRAQRIIAEAAGVDAEHAARMLDASGNNVRLAILMAKRGLNRDDAAALLERSGGRLAEALHG
ncbi:MAG: N-acetylmuramic acid 6-phosphate etherase [Acidobacteriota bacterium]